MSIKDLIGGSLDQAVGAATGAAKDKAKEAADKVLGSLGSWGDAKKLLASGKDKLQGAADFLRGKKKEADKGLSPAEVDAAIDAASKAGENTPLDEFEADLRLQRDVQADITASQLKQLLNGNQTDIIAHKVRLVEKGVDAVVFDVMPEVVENRTVEYEAIAPPQYPTAFQKYKGTSSTQWTVQATLTCRNTAEATENLRILNVLRGWTMPFFGDKIKSSYPKKLGAPPPVLEFSGWRNQMVGPVQVVITSLNWNFPQDVDYIPAEGFKGKAGALERTGELIPFPTVIKIAIQLVESFSTDQVNGFDLVAFRAGNFDRAFAQTLSNELKTGKRSPTGLEIGGAPVPEEAQTVAGNPLSDAERAALNAAEGFPPVSEAASVADGAGPNASFGTSIGDFDQPIQPAEAPPPPPPSSVDEQKQANLETRKGLAILIQNEERNVQVLQTYYDRTVAEATRLNNLGLAASGLDDPEADRMNARAETLRVRLENSKNRVTNLGQRYEELLRENEALDGPRGDEGE